MMDIINLQPWQVKYIESMLGLKIKGETRIKIADGKIYFYPNKETLKELTQNGKTNNSK